MHIDFADLHESIKQQFFHCNEMNADQADAYADLAVYQFKKHMGLLRSPSNATTLIEMGLDA